MRCRLRTQTLDLDGEGSTPSFLARLDKDRRDKGREYAVLVSMLEEDSDLYTGITDVSHEYPKMFIVRPQFFVAVIGLLRNAAQGTIVVRAELEQVKKQNIDITNFEADLDDFKSAFGRNYDLAKRKFDTAIDEIDKAIERLQKVKEGLLGSENNLRLAEALQQRGVTAWLDKAEMRIGESLRRRVDQGLAASRFAVVVLSPSYFAKGWPQYELDGIVTLSIAGKQNLLPIWHDLGHAEVMAKSPSLADKFARTTADTYIEAIADEVADLINGSR